MNRLIFFVFVLLNFISYGQITESKRDEKTGKFGFIDDYGKWVVKPEFSYCVWDKNGKIGIAKKSENKNSGAVFNQNGKRLTDFCYSGASRSEKYGPIIVHQVIDITFQNDDIVFEELIYGIIDEKGKMLLPINEDNNKPLIYYPRETNQSTNFKGSILIERIDKMGRKWFRLVNWNGKPIINGEFEEIQRWVKDEDIYIVKLGDKYGVYRNDKLLINLEFDDYKLEQQYCIIVNKNKKWGVIGLKDTSLLVPIIFDDISYSNIPDSWLIKKNGKWGLYYNQEEIIPCKYDELNAFNDNVARATLDGEIVLIKNPLLASEEIKIASTTSDKKEKKENNRPKSRYPAPNSEVDLNIPESTETSNNKFAFIIANENYENSPVPYALNDGRIFSEYCNKALGIPTSNIKMFEDATYAQIQVAMDQLKDIAESFDGEASFILYYAGHGVPDEANGSAYLLPTDGDISSIEKTCLSLSKIYEKLSKVNANGIVVLIDACFSGAKREDEMLLSGRGIAIDVKEESPSGNVVIFSASTGNETAHQLEDKHHGLFTYYLLKAIQDENGAISMGKLADSVIKNVKRQSVVINSKKQTPTVVPSLNIKDSWRDIIL